MNQTTRDMSSTSAPSTSSNDTLEEGHRFSHVLERVSDLCGAGGLSFKELFDILEAKSHSGIILLLSLPFLVPVTIPGFSTPFGLLIIIAAAGMTMGLKPWLPGKLEERRLQGEFLCKAFSLSGKLIARLEKIVRPRGRWLIGNTFVYRLNGILLVIAGFLLALPTPPGGNFPPAVALVALSLGTLEEDAFLTIVGYIAFVLNVLLFGSIAYFGLSWASELLGYFVA